MAEGAHTTEALQKTIAELRIEVATLQAERILLSAEIKELTLAANEARRDKKRVGEDLAASQGREAVLQGRIHALEAALQTEQGVRAGLVGSLSWRITEPLRRVMKLVRSLRR